MNKIIVICGPTASGKTSLAIEVAKRFDAEIVSADSMQIYKEMNIGTAKPDYAERDGITHHMMDIISVSEDYNVSRYVLEAGLCIDDIISRGKNVVVAGGTGMYIDSLINNVDFFEFENDDDYRSHLSDIAKAQGGQALVDMLEKIDPDSATRLHQNDTKRLIRALEVYKVTGKTMTQLHIESKRNRKYQPIFVGINFSDRQKLYDRINLRVDKMIEQGFVDEVQKIEKLLLSSTSRAAIGYDDIISFLKGDVSLDMAIDSVKQKSRNYAKRQITWFKKNGEIKWFYFDEYKDPSLFSQDVITYINGELR